MVVIKTHMYCDKPGCGRTLELAVGVTDGHAGLDAALADANWTRVDARWSDRSTTDRFHLCPSHSSAFKDFLRRHESNL